MRMTSVIFDSLFAISLSIIGKSKELGYNKLRSHRAVIIMSYVIGLLLSSSMLVVVSCFVSVQWLNIGLFILIFVVCLVGPYFVVNRVYIQFERYLKDAVLTKAMFYSDKRTLFSLVYLFAHFYFLYISFLAGKN